MEGLYEYIKQFAVLDIQEFNSLTHLLEVRHFDKRTIITNEGDIENYLYFIEEGLIRKYFIHEKNEIITQLAREKDLVCSSVSFLSRQPSDYIVETLEPCLVYALSFENLEKMYAAGAALNRLGRLIIIDWLVQKEIWEQDRIRQTPKERFVRFIQNNPGLFERVPQKYLASYLNIKPETFSRYKHLLA